MSDYILEMENIDKSFPGVKALDNVSFSVKRGEVHALIGENGAGKSTLMKVLNGVYKADRGELYIDSKKVELKSINHAQSLGLALIFQEINLVQTLSVAENIFLGKLKKGGNGLVDWKKIISDSKEILHRMDFDLNVMKLVRDISVAEKQMVEIARALSADAKVIVMDEPTSSLTKVEVEKLFNLIQILKRNGVTIVYISHKLDEIFRICDTVTILRDGKVIDTKPVTDITKNEIIEKMVGRSVDMEFPKRSVKPGEVVFEAKNIKRKKLLFGIDLTLRKGEVLGIAGLVGSGRTEFAEAIFGAEKIEDGEIFINGKKVLIHSTKDAKANSIGMITEERKETGLVLDFSVARNLTITNLKKVSGAFFSIVRKKENKVAKEYVQKLNIKTPSINQKVVNLSGGNQQKVVIAKWLFSDADILILDEPTRGIDVGAKYEIYLLINQLAEKGKSIIMISSELPEVLGMSDRIIVMHNGVIKGELTGSDINAEAVMRLAVN